MRWTPEAAETVWPCLRDWSDPAEAAERLRAAVEGGAGGFIVFGGDADALRDVAGHLRAMRPEAPPVLSADLERGAGQQFGGLTRLPTPMAIAATGRPDLAERAGALTASEARAAGVGVVFAPVCDVNIDAANPIVNVRAFSDDPSTAAAYAAAWTRGCERAGAAATPKHFPGHGRTALDSHIELARLDAPLADLERAEFPPFAAAFAAGARCAMIAHLACAAWSDPRPATRSPAALLALRRLGFDGVAFTDAMIMGGAGADADTACVEALSAGCDVLLYPADFAAAATAVSRRVDPARIAQAAGRVRRLRASLDAPAAAGAFADAGLPDEIAAAAVTHIGPPGPPVRLPAGARLLVVTDDPKADPAPLIEALRDRGAAPDLQRAAPADLPEGNAAAVALYLFPRAWRGRAGLSAEEAERLDALCRRAPTAVVSFGDPYSLAPLRSAAARLAAWDDTPAMQRAAAAALTGAPTPGRLPISLG